MMRQLDYFTRGGSTGRREVFAEAFAALAGGGCLNHDILSAMPRTSQAVLDIVRSTGGRPADDGLTQGEMKRARLK